MLLYIFRRLHQGKSKKKRIDNAAYIYPAREVLAILYDASIISSYTIELIDPKKEKCTDAKI